MSSCNLPEKLWILRSAADSCKDLASAVEYEFQFRITERDQGIIPENIHANFLLNKHAVIVGRNPVPRRIIVKNFSYMGKFTRVQFEDTRN